MNLWYNKLWLAGALFCILQSSAGCAPGSGGSHTVRSPDPVAVAADTSLFAAVVREALAWSPLLRVDPRPLRSGINPARSDSVFARSGPETLMLDADAVQQLVPLALLQPDSNSFARVPPEVIRARVAVLERLGVPQTDAVADARCRSGFLPPAPGEPPRDFSGCPAEGQYRSAVFALPRPGGVYWGKTDQRVKGLKKGYWTVRSTGRTMTPTGSSAGVAEYVVERTPGGIGWRMVEMVPVLVVD